MLTLVARGWLGYAALMSETQIDRETMGRLSKALAFICGADHACTVALKKAAESGTPADIKRARALNPSASVPARAARG